MPILKQKDKKSGRIYVYEAITKYDPEKKCTVYASRKLIGHVDPKTNQTILNRETRPYRSLPSTKRDYYGSTYLLNEIAKKTGVYEDLKTLTPCVNEILSLCYYMICEDNSPIYRFSKWGSMHWHPHEKDITSQQGTELFSKLDQHIVDSFCRSRARRQSGCRRRAA